MKCKKHCSCYKRLLKKQIENAKRTNSMLTSEQRSKAAKKAWLKRNMKKQINEFTGDVEYTQCEKCGSISNFDRDECNCVDSKEEDDVE